MKIAVFTDAHANLPATRAAIQAIQDEGCDLIYHLGDAIAIGPHPAETLDLLLSTPRIRLLQGNHDHRFIHGLPDPLPPNIGPGEVEHQIWTHAQLDPAMRRVMFRFMCRNTGFFSQGMCCLRIVSAVPIYPAATTKR